jgi:hypothetical protein
MNGTIQSAPDILNCVVLSRREGILGALTGRVDRGLDTKRSVSIALPLQGGWKSETNCCITGLGDRADYEAIVRKHVCPRTDPSGRSATVNPDRLMFPDARFVGNVRSWRRG